MSSRLSKLTLPETSIKQELPLSFLIIPAASLIWLVFILSNMITSAMQFIASSNSIKVFTSTSI
jgi:hypothetical protein